MDKIINQIKEILQQTAPKCVDSIYLYFEDIEDLVSITFYVRIGDKEKSYFDVKMEYKDYFEETKLAVSQLLTLVQALYSSMDGIWTWGEINLHLKNNTGKINLFNNKWNYYDYLSENRYIWEYINFGKIYPKDCYSSSIYSKIISKDKIDLVYKPIFEKPI